MKLIANTSRIFEMGVSSEIPTGNLVWVDRVNGNDLIALRGRMDRPFLTLSKAKIAASVGDTIIVGPGVYNDTNLARDGVHWHFLTGASVVNAVGSTAIFNVTTGMNFKVTGQGEFSSSAALTGNGCITVSAGISTISFQCMKLSSDATTAYIGSSANVTIKVAQILATGADPALLVSSAAAVVQVDADSVTSVDDSALSITNGTLVATVGSVQSTNAPALTAQNGTVVVSARELISTADHSVDYYGGNVTLNRVRIITNWSSTSALAVRVAGGPTLGPAGLKLVQCILISLGGSFAIDGVTTSRLVAYYGDCLANKNEGSNIARQVGFLIPDGNVV